MKLSRPRFTVRRLMVAVGIVATLLAVRAHLLRLADRYRALAKYHQSQYFAVISRGKKWDGELDENRMISLGTGSPNDETMSGRELAVVLWHVKLFEKYQSAANRPWFPAWPDPLEPK